MAYRSKGITMQMDGAPIANVKSINGGGWSVDVEEVTPIDADEKEYLDTITDLNEVTIVLFWDPEEASHVDLDEARDTQRADGAKTYVLSFPEPLSVTRSFKAFVTSFEFGEFTAASVLEATIKLRPTGGYL